MNFSENEYSIKVMQNVSTLLLINLFENEFHFIEHKNDNLYIRHFQDELLSSSKFVHKACLLCGFRQRDALPIKWVQCDSCLRRFINSFS